MSSSQDGTTSPKSLFGWYKEHITGAIASFAALATMAGLPAGIMGVYISINTLCDMGATCVNVIGDMAGCVVLKEKIRLDD